MDIVIITNVTGAVMIAAWLVVLYAAILKLALPEQTYTKVPNHKLSTEQLGKVAFSGAKYYNVKTSGQKEARIERAKGKKLMKKALPVAILLTIVTIVLHHYFSK